MSNVSVVETATAVTLRGSASAAAKPRALVAGLIVGLILVALWETLSTKPRTEQEVEALLGMPFLARLKLGRGRSPLRTQAASEPDADDVTRFASTSSSQAARRVLARS